MTVYTMGFAQKNAKKFFDLIKKNSIQLVVDIRLNNKSQLAGFTKGEDLSYFLKTICNCEYMHRIDFAPTKEILDNYRKGVINWQQYEEKFIPLLRGRGSVKVFLNNIQQYDNICLLCTEPTSEHCHRRLVAEEIARIDESVEIRHI